MMWLVYSLAILVAAVRGEDATINLMFMSSGGGQYNSSGAEPAVDLAVKLINENEVIPGYQLNIATRGNSSCDRKIALDSFLTDVSVGEDKLAIIGCGCSVATEAVAEISSFWNITHMSYASAVDTLSDRQRFPHFWRTHTAESNLAASVIGIMKEYGWTVLKIITQQESLFVESTQTMISMLEEEDITIDTNGNTSFSSSMDITNATGYYEPEIRIYFLNMYSLHARRFLCSAAFNRSNSDPAFHVPGYVWILLGWYRDQWWTEVVSQDELSGCSDSVIESLLNQTISIQEANSAPDRNAPTDVNLTAAEFKEQYTSLLGDNYLFEPTATNAYDAVWALAFAIERSLSDSLIDLDEFSYANGSNTTNAIQSQLSDPTFSFKGVSGYVEFDESGTRRATEPQILKYRISNNGIIRDLVAVINGTAFVYINNETDNTVWPDSVPADGSPENLIVPVFLPVAIIYYVVASAGIIFALVCLFFNIIFRNRKIIRLISPNLNYVIVVGAIMTYASVYFFIISTTDPFLITFACHFRIWLQVIGYYLCFGTILLKMWRVYYIFHNPSIKRKKSRIPKDWHLFLGVVSLCLLMAALMSIVAAVAEYGAQVTADNERSDTDRNDATLVLINYQNLVCGGERALYWQIVLYFFIIVPQIVGVILAFRTRKVHIKALNDSKYLAVIIYTTAVIVTIMIIGAIILDRFLTIDAAVFGGLLTLFATVLLGLTFIPKMVILYKDPKGEKIFDRGQSQGTLNLTAADEARIEQFGDLEKHCLELESRLSKYETVTPFKSITRSSSTRKYSSSLSYLGKTPVHSVNPASSLPTTLRTGFSDTTETKITQVVTGDYLSDASSNGDKTENTGLETDGKKL